MSYSKEQKDKALELYERTGSANKVSKETGIPRRTVDRWVRSRNYIVKGTSTLYDEEDNVKLTWEKVELDKQRQNEAFQEAIEAFKEDLPKYSPTKPPRRS